MIEEAEIDSGEVMSQTREIMPMKYVKDYEKGMKGTP